MKAFEEVSQISAKDSEPETSGETVKSFATAAMSQGKKLKDKVVQFSKITVYYFRRKQSFCTIPAKGGTTLGMARRHSCVEQYLLESSRRASLPTESLHDKADDRTVFRVSEKSRKAFLKDAGVMWIKDREADECRKIRLSRSTCGCKCRNHCEPTSCICSLNGVPCQVDNFKRKFPCSCGIDKCKNPEGCRVYKSSEVKQHYETIFEKMKENNLMYSTCCLADSPL